MPFDEVSRVYDTSSNDTSSTKPFPRKKSFVSNAFDDVTFRRTGNSTKTLDEVS